MQMEDTPFSTFIFHTLLNAIKKTQQNTQYKDAKKPTHYATTFSLEYCISLSSAESVPWKTNYK